MRSLPIQSHRGPQRRVCSTIFGLARKSLFDTWLPGCALGQSVAALTHSSPMKLHLLCRSNKSFQCHISSINSVYQISLIFASFGKIQLRILSLCLSSLLWLLIHSFCTRQMFRLAQIFSSSTEFCLVLDGNRSNLAAPSLLRIQTQVKKALELSRSRL